MEIKTWRSVTIRDGSVSCQKLSNVVRKATEQKYNKFVHTHQTSCRAVDDDDPMTPTIWWINSQSSRSNIDGRLSWCQPSLLLILSRCCPNACLHCTKVWNRTYPIFEAKLRYRNCAKITVLMCEPGAVLGGGGRACALSPPPHSDDLRFSNKTGILQKKKTIWFIGVEVEQETSAPPPKKNPGSAPVKEAPSGVWLSCRRKNYPV